MAQYDGSIRINTEINTKNASAQLMSLESRIAKTADKISSLRSEMDSLKNTQVPTKAYKDLEKELSTAEKKADGFYGKLREIEKSKGYTGADTIKKEEAELKKMEKELSRLTSVRDRSFGSPEFGSATRAVAEYEKKVDSLKQKLEEQLATNEKIRNSAPYQKVIADIKAYEQRVNELRANLDELKESGQAFTLGSDTQRYADLGRQVEYLENDYSVLIQRRNEFEQRHNIQPGGYERLQAALEGVKSRISGILHPIESMKSAFSSAAASIKERAAGIAASIINGVTHPIQSLKLVASSVTPVVSKIFSGMASSAKKAGSVLGSVVSKLKSAASSMLSLKNSTGSANNMFKASIGNILKYGLGIRSLYALVSKFRTGVKEGFQNLAQYSAPVNAALSSLMSALTQLKNSLATAFAPILTAVAPELTTLINLVSRAATAVGMLIAALTGKKTFVKASKVQQNYAASLGKTAKAAKKAGSAAKKAAKSLAAFDKLTVLDNNDSDDSGGGGGGGGLGGIGDMFETVDIPSKVKDFADMLKKAWKNADFTEIGALIGQKLKEGLESVPWDKIQATAEKVGKSLATLINGFIEVPGLAYTVGNTIAQAINTGLIGLEAFAANLHWDSVGKFIADGINGVLENIDWETALSAASLFGSGIATALNNALTEDVFENIGYTLGMLLNTALTFAENFADTFDWYGFGSNVASGVNKSVETADWKQLGRTIGKLITGVLTSLDKFLVKTKWFDIGKYVATSLNELIKATDFGLIGKTIADSLNAIFGMLGGFAYTFDWSGLGSKLAESVNTFVSNFDWEKNGANLGQIAKGVLDTIVTFLEETVWQEIGRSLAKFVGAIDWSGLATSLSEGIGAALGGIAAAIWGFIEEAWDKVVKWWERTAFKDGKFTIEGLLKGILEAVKNIGKWVKEHIVDPFVKGFKDALGIHSPSTVMAEQGGFIIDGLLKGIKDSWTGFIDFWKQKITDIVGGFKDIKDKFLEKGKNIVEGIKSGISEKWSGFTDFWTDKKDKIVDKFSDIKDKFNNKGNNIISGIKSGILEKWSDFSSFWGEKKTTVVDKFKDIKEKFQTKGGNIVSGIKSGISGNWGEFSSYWGKKKTDVVDKFKDIKEKFNTKGSNIVSGIKSGISGDWSAFYKDWGLKKDSITKVFSNIGNEMAKIGKSIVDGLVSGIKSVWSNITNIAGKIKDAFTGGTSSGGKSGGVTGAQTRTAVHPTYYEAIPAFATLDIPKLANGAVIRGGDPFMAVLGDQPRNQTNIETPLPTMVNAFKQAIAESGGVGSGNITVQAILDGKIIYEQTVKQNRIEFKRSGKNRLAY